MNYSFVEEPFLLATRTYWDVYGAEAESKTLEEKLKTLVNEGEERKKKYQARKFYRIRKRRKKKNPPKPKLEDIPEEDDHSAHEEEEGYKSA